VDRTFRLLPPTTVTSASLADKEFVIVNRYGRKLPPNRIPISGGTVDFDQRFGRQAGCTFNSRQ
jgi:hypothetical protein